MEKKELISGLNKILKAIGFKLKGNIWNKSCNEFSLLVNLRKSRWANKYYLEVGLIFGNDQSGNYLSGTKNIDLNIAVNNLVPDLDTDILDPVLDLNISTDIEFNKALELLKEKLVPYLEKMNSLAGVKELYNMGNLKAAGINKTARDIIGIS